MERFLYKNLISMTYECESFLELFHFAIARAHIQTHAVMVWKNHTNTEVNGRSNTSKKATVLRIVLYHLPGECIAYIHTEDDKNDGEDVDDDE